MCPKCGSEEEQTVEEVKNLVGWLIGYAYICRRCFHYEFEPIEN